MSGDTAVQLIWFVGALTLVISALVARRLPMKDWIKMALAWATIFGVVFLAIWTFQTARGG